MADTSPLPTCVCPLMSCPELQSSSLCDKKKTTEKLYNKNNVVYLHADLIIMR